MEKSRAIDLLDNLIGMVEDNQDNDYDAAFRMAIDALKAQLSQESATKGATSDTISRQAAIDALRTCYDTETISMDNGDEYINYGDAVGGIEQLPTVQPEPHEGHWIDKGWNGDWAWQIDGRGNCWRVIECSECGKSVSVESNYCPHCGADMRGEQDG